MKAFLLLSALFFSVSAFADTIAFKQELKQKLKFELNALEVSMMSANNEIAQLREDKAHIDADLHNMEEWGKQQEEQKNEYYHRTVELTNDIAITQANVDLEKEKGKATLARYHRVKSLLGYVFGVFLAYLYIQIGVQALTLMTLAVTGPWALVLRFAGPVGAFGLGYFTVNILF